MGAEQSSARDKSHGQTNTGEQHVKTCYYELLGVDRLVNEDEIKKAYRRKALELHPDRNYGDVENATKLFAEIQSAYQVLSDPQERAWYDSHRDAILRDVDFGSDEHFEHNIRLTSAADLISLIGKFTTSIPFTDTPNGFYGSLRSTFETLAKEENAACDWEGLESIEYPDFGTAQDSYELVVKPFYTAWAGFATKKTFSWKDTHNFTDAPDRRIRRLMEKDNKRLREEGIKEFNDAVRSLVGFVRKRDPRYTPNTQSEADRQRILRDAAAAQAARSRAIHKAKLDEHVQPAWAQSCHAEEEEGAFSESEQSEEEVIECVTCNKIFKSEKQYEAHEKSKKHIKAVQQLMRQMRKENKLLNLDVQLPDIAAPLQQNPGNDDSEVTFDSSKYVPDIEASHAVKNSQIESEFTSNTHFAVVEPDQKDDVSKAGYDEVLSDLASEDGFQECIDDEYAPRKQVEDRISGLSNPDQQASEMDYPIRTGSIDNVTVMLDAISISSDGNIDRPLKEVNKKLGKAKAKRAKKAARQQIDTDDQNLICTACNEIFSSKTKLFLHIKKVGHAQAPKPNIISKGKPVHNTKLVYNV